MLVMNESLRVKQDFAHTNAAIGGMRVQLHWLMSARLQGQQRIAMASGEISGDNHITDTSSRVSDSSEGRVMPVRRSSDTTKQETKL